MWIWQDNICPHNLFDLQKKAMVIRTLIRQAVTGRREVAEQVWQAVSLLSLHLTTIISMKRRMIIVMNTND